MFFVMFIASDLNEVIAIEATQSKTAETAAVPVLEIADFGRMAWSLVSQDHHE